MEFLYKADLFYEHLNYFLEVTVLPFQSGDTLRAEDAVIAHRRSFSTANFTQSRHRFFLSKHDSINLRKHRLNLSQRTAPGLLYLREKIDE